ncbi:hypothetical protein [Microvirga lotononidis]|uniref:Uncharacterized protein n=1 Tax=Microvirga lotononidis TaxID=864069 RepID=I4YRS8_9HYPH|nr:hypothetical protein [Microvirga lotononidis]EIM26670.1 hypothetical protein MicloDRAFT_00032200 [Microvirga lotononidis]WQO32099.1 hypothetical protein U0023_35205 [Microvirga lotononidis]
MDLMPGTAITAFVGGVSFFVSLVFKIPPGLESFRFFAAFAAMAGYGVGRVLAKRAAGYSLGTLIGIMLVDLAIGSAAALTYVILVETFLAPEMRLVIQLAVLLCVTFFCLGAVLPLAGLRFNK